MQAVTSFAHCLRSMELKAYGSCKNAFPLLWVIRNALIYLFIFGTVESGALIRTFSNTLWKIAAWVLKVFPNVWLFAECYLCEELSPPLLTGCLASDKNGEVRMDYSICTFIKLKRYLVEIWMFLFDYYFIWLLPD